jgi:hypothetical protein
LPVIRIDTADRESAKRLVQRLVSDFGGIASAQVSVEGRCYTVRNPRVSIDGGNYTVRNPLIASGQ